MLRWQRLSHRWISQRYSRLTLSCGTTCATRWPRAIRGFDCSTSRRSTAKWHPIGRPMPSPNPYRSRRWNSHSGAPHARDCRSANSRRCSATRNRCPACATTRRSVRCAKCSATCRQATSSKSAPGGASRPSSSTTWHAGRASVQPSASTPGRPKTWSKRTRRVSSMARAFRRTRPSRSSSRT